MDQVTRFHIKHKAATEGAELLELSNQTDFLAFTYAAQAALTRERKPGERIQLLAQTANGPVILADKAW